MLKYFMLKEFFVSSITQIVLYYYKLVFTKLQKHFVFLKFSRNVCLRDEKL